MKAYIGFGTILEGNGKAQYRRTGGFVNLWVTGLCWWAGLFTLFYSLLP